MFNVQFGDYLSYYDLHLIMESYDIPPAEPKTSFIELPGGDGSIDTTEALGLILYKNRNATWTFIYDPNHSYNWDSEYNVNWRVAKEVVSSALNGKKMRIVMDNDLEHYWVGRLTVSSYESDNNFLRITVTAVLDPYKYHDAEVTYELSANQVLETSLHNEYRSVLPHVTTTGRITIRTATGSYATSAAEDVVFSGFRFVQGDNAFTITASDDAVVTIKYQEGQL